jgi:hypothetical protein
MQPDSIYGVLSPAVTRVIQFDQRYARVEVVNLDGAGGICVLPCPTPEQDSAGIDWLQDGTWPIPESPSSRIIPISAAGDTRLLLVSNGTPAFCVLPG